MTALADGIASLAAEKDPPPHLRDKPWSKPEGWKITVTSDSADISTDSTEQKIVAADDWDGVLRHFGLNPAEFQVEDDTVKMSSWQQSKGHEDGSRDVVTLYSYRARFRRITDRLPDSDVNAVMDRVRKWKPIRRTPGRGLGTPGSFYAGWADWQGGKSAAGGHEGLEQRVLDSFDATIARIKELRRVGRNVQSLTVANMGDPLEGCYGHYDSQLFTVTLTQRQQLSLILDLWLTGLRALAPMFDDVQFVSVLSNHSEWTRQTTGGKQVTSDSDSADGFLAETVQRVLAGRPDFDHVRFTVPHDEMTVLTDVAGVPVAFAHGHKAPGSAKELEWLRGQSIRLLREHGREPRLWMTAHRHHLEVKDYGPWSRLQHPSLDSTPGATDGSKWFTDMSGMWSTPGTLTCVIGEHEQARHRYFSDLAVV